MGNASACPSELVVLLVTMAVSLALAVLELLISVAGGP